MTKQFDGKVAFITGAARGLGRSNAVRFAEEGADVVAVDICKQIDSVGYPLASREDLEETVRLVEKTGRRIVGLQCDVRDFSGLEAAVGEAVAELGRIDFVIANAGIAPMTEPFSMEMTAFVDAIDVMLAGVYYTIEAALPAVLSHGDGGAIVITSSAGGLRSMCARYSLRSHGIAGYTTAKHGVVGLMRYYATSLAEKNIRVNTVHPTGLASPMVINDAMDEYFKKPGASDAMQNLLPVGLIDAIDVSEAMIYLCSQAGRYITGIALPIDAGYVVK